MKNIYLILIALVLFSGCNPCLRLARKCPPQIITIVKDSIIIKDSVIYKDRIVTEIIPGDIQYIDKPITTDKLLNVKPIFAQTKYAEASAGVRDSKLWLELEQKEQVITHILDSADREIFHWKEMYKNKEVTEQTIIKERYTPKFFKFTAWVALLLIIVVGVGVYIRIKGGLLKRS